MAGEFPIVFALYPRVTQLDFTGPLEVLARLPGAAIVLAAVRGGELAVDSGITFANVRPLAEVQECALLCVPGGLGTAAAMVASIGFLGLALKSLPVGTAYAVWTGIGTIGTTALGIYLFNEPATLLRLACIGLILSGIIGLKITS